MILIQAKRRTCLSKQLQVLKEVADSEKTVRTARIKSTLSGYILTEKSSILTEDFRAAIWRKTFRWVLMVWLILRRRWAPVLSALKCSQKSLKVKSANKMTFSRCLTASRKSLPRIKKTRRWSFLLRVMEATEEVIDPRTSSERVSGKPHFRAGNCRGNFCCQLSL